MVVEVPRHVDGAFLGVVARLSVPSRLEAWGVWSVEQRNELLAVDTDLSWSWIFINTHS
jgi:hypothetical protein